MPSDPLIHKNTQQMLEAYLKNPPHALLLIGPSGMGKFTVAKHWSQKLTGTKEAEVISPDEKGAISIETVRTLYRSARSKREGRQVIIIDQAQTMSTAAENAFLKLLEEPRPGVTFILTAPHINALLPTIISRSQCVNVRPISAKIMQDAVYQANPHLSPTDIAQLMFIADGKPATAIKLASNTDTLQQSRQIMQQAKELLAAKPYQRICAIGKLTSDKNNCIATLEAMQRMACIQLKRTNSNQSKQWLNTINTLETTLQQITHNGNLKAQLLALFTKI